MRRFSFVFAACLALLILSFQIQVQAGSESTAHGGDTGEAFSERISLLEKRVFEMEMQLKTPKGSGSKGIRSWFGRQAATTEETQNEGPKPEPLKAFSHLSRGRLAHVLASGQDKWHDFMRLKVAVMTRGSITSVCKIPGKRQGYFATATDEGNLQVFHPVTGEIVFERKLSVVKSNEAGEETCADENDTSGKEYLTLFSPVTAMGSIQVRRNESKLFVGHANGDVFSYHFSEKLTKSVNMPDEQVQFKLKESPTRLLSHTHEPLIKGDQSEPESAVEGNQKEEAETPGVGGSAVTRIESYKLGVKYFQVVTNKAGELFVLHDNGTLLYKEQLEDPIVALRPGLQQTITLVTAGGIRMLDLRKLRKTTVVECEDFPEEVRIFSSTFDPLQNSKGYMITDTGDVISIHVISNKNNIRCLTKTHRVLGLPTHFEREAMVMSTIKNYLFVSIPQGTAIFNTTGPHRRPPREILFEDKWSMAKHVGLDYEGEALQTLLASQKDFVAISLGKRVLGIYQSALPQKSQLPMQTKMWSQPIFLMAMLVMGFYQFNRMKGARSSSSGGSGGGLGGMGLPGMDGMGGMSDVDIQKIARDPEFMNSYRQLENDFRKTR